MQNITFEIPTLNQTTLNDVYQEALQQGFLQATAKFSFIMDALFVAALVTIIVWRLPAINAKKHWFSDVWIARFNWIFENALTFWFMLSYTLFLMKHAMF